MNKKEKLYQRQTNNKRLKNSFARLLWSDWGKKLYAKKKKIKLRYKKGKVESIQNIWKKLWWVNFVLFIS